MAQTKAVAKKNEVKTLVKSYEARFASMLPQILSSRRFVQVILTAMIKNPKIYECTQESLIKSCFDAGSIGLEPDGRLAHLIPYGKTCTLIVDYKGLVELAYRSGQVLSIQGDWVCDNDEYEENLGKVVKHVIDRKKERGNPYCCYTHVVLKTGAESFRIMSKTEIEELRDTYSQGYKRDKKSSPWTTAPRAMWLKTCFRDHSKWIPSSPELRDAIAKDGDMAPTKDMGSGPVIDIVPDEIPASAGKKAAPKATPPPADPPKQDPPKDGPENPEGGEEFDPTNWTPGAE